MRMTGTGRLFYKLELTLNALNNKSRLQREGECTICATSQNIERPLPPLTQPFSRASLSTEKEKNPSAHPPRLPQAQKKKKQPKSTSACFSPPVFAPTFCFTTTSSIPVSIPFQAIHSTKVSLTAQTNTLRRGSPTPRTFHRVGSSRITAARYLIEANTKVA
jgi:hypothetical protein